MKAALPQSEPAFVTALARSVNARILLCGGPRCRRFALAHQWLRRDGILLAGAPGSSGGDIWLCSLGCFESALLQRITEKVDAAGPGRSDTKPRLPRMPFRLVLLSQGVLTESDLDAAAAHAAQTEVSLATALSALRLCTPEQLAAAFASENGCAYYTLGPTPVAAALLLPPALSRYFGAVTVYGTADRAVLGFTERIDRGLLRLCTQMFGCRVEPCFITPTHYAAQLSLDGMSVGTAATSSGLRTASAASAVQLIAQQSARSGAEQVRCARSGDLLWVRHAGGDNVARATHELFLLVEAQVAGAPDPDEKSGIAMKKLRAH